MEVKVDMLEVKVDMLEVQEELEAVAQVQEVVQAHPEAVLEELEVLGADMPEDSHHHHPPHLAYQEPEVVLQGLVEGEQQQQVEQELDPGTASSQGKSAHQTLLSQS